MLILYPFHTVPFRTNSFKTNTEKIKKSAMDFIPLLFPLCIIFWTCFHILTSIRRAPKLPPGPPLFPVIGNILQLGQNPHQSLAELSKTYGPFMHLKLGSIHTIVVSSPELAKQVLQKHDHILSSRPHPAATTVYGHNTTSVAWLPAAGQWRGLRKICKDQMFSLQRLEESKGFRHEKLKKLRDYVQECCDSGRVLDISDAAFATSLNLMSATMFSMDFAQFRSDLLEDFKEIVLGLLKAASARNLADCLPVLKAVDPQGIKKKSAEYVGKAFRILEEIIDRRLQSEGSATVDAESKRDFLAALLDISRKNESEFSRNDMMHLLLDLFVAGIDTTATTVEWAMAELIRNPTKMTKARNELQTIVVQKGHIQESDITRLPYLQAIIKETFRLHPAGPLLMPHKAETDIEINNYIIPKNAQVLVNVWAIGRDSSLWSNPDSFEPERFLGSKIDIRGQDFGLIPFGSGRRICPGLPLAYRMVHLVVATLIQKFDWEVEGGIRPEEMNMDEKFELTLQKAVPLRAVPVEI